MRYYRIHADDPTKGTTMPDSAIPKHRPALGLAALSAKPRCALGPEKGRPSLSPGAFGATMQEHRGCVAHGPRPGRRPVARRAGPTPKATRSGAWSRAASPGQRRRPTPSRVAVPHALHAASAARKDDAVLAQPLRHQQRQGAQRRLHARPVRAAAPACPGQLPHVAAGDVARPGHDGLARHHPEQEAARPTRTTPAS